MIGTVGAAFVYTEICLEEVPDMGYDPFGDPPRGEICLRGKTPFVGYYKDEELTKEVVTDGWFHTGNQRNTCLQIINLFSSSIILLLYYYPLR